MTTKRGVDVKYDPFIQDRKRINKNIRNKYKKKEIYKAHSLHKKMIINKRNNYDKIYMDDIMVMKMSLTMGFISHILQPLVTNSNILICTRNT